MILVQIYHQFLSVDLLLILLCILIYSAVLSVQDVVRSIHNEALEVSFLANLLVVRHLQEGLV